MTNMSFADPAEAIRFLFEEMSRIQHKLEALRNYTGLLAHQVSATTDFDVAAFNRAIVSMAGSAHANLTTEEAERQIQELRAIARYVSDGAGAQIIPFPDGS